MSKTHNFRPVVPMGSHGEISVSTDSTRDHARPALAPDALVKHLEGHTRPARLLLKLALRACERGDTEAAAEALRGVLALPASERAPTPASRRAVTLAKFALMLGYSTRHIRGLLARGVVPSDAVIGAGRAKRILVERAVDGRESRQ
jgi:hypothetical protein